MSSRRYPLIAREGWVLVAASLLLALLVAHYIGVFWSLPLWLVCGFILFMFRDPDREIPPIPLAVVSPVDGEVTAVESVRDPYLDRESVRLSLRMSHIGVYTTRAPVEAKMLEPRQLDGNVDKDTPHGVWLQTDEGDDLVLVMRRGPLHTTPRCYVGFGERVGQGQRCGFVHLGSQVDIYVPEHSRIDVQVGDRVRGGTDIIASLVHK